jgi:hypothetical protein
MVQIFCCQEVNELLKSRYKLVSRPTHLWISVASRSLLVLRATQSHNIQILFIVL